MTIPNSVTSIGNQAFEGCSKLKDIIINGCPTIGNNAFSKCNRIQRIYVNSELAPYVLGGFESDIYKYAYLHVPMGSYEEYSSAYCWRNFERIKTDTDVNGKTYYTTLAVKQGQTGYVEHYVKADNSYTLYIGTESANSKINTVMFNGEDVTDKLENGYLTTPAITKASVLTVSFEQTTNAKPLLSDTDNIRVYGYDGRLYISGVDKTTSYYIYRSGGELVSNGNVHEDTCIDLPDDFYIVKIGQRTFKVAM